MRGDNGAAVWWLAPHRPAGPGGWRRGLRRDERVEGGKRGDAGEKRREGKGREEKKRGDRLMEEKGKRGGSEIGMEGGFQG